MQTQTSCVCVCPRVLRRTTTRSREDGDPRCTEVEPVCYIRVHARYIYVYGLREMQIYRHLLVGSVECIRTAYVTECLRTSTTAVPKA